MATEKQHRHHSVFGEIVDWTLAPLLILWPISMAIPVLPRVHHRQRCIQPRAAEPRVRARAAGRLRRRPGSRCACRPVRRRPAIDEVDEIGRGIASAARGRIAFTPSGAKGAFMEATALALKTPKGHEEVRSRARAGLSRKLRTLLIMIDGKSTVGGAAGALSRCGGDPGESPPAHRGLGFVQLADRDVPRAGGRRCARARGCRRSASAGSPTRELGMSGLVRVLIEGMGPDADLVAGCSSAHARRVRQGRAAVHRHAGRGRRCAQVGAVLRRGARIRGPLDPN